MLQLYKCKSVHDKKLINYLCRYFKLKLNKYANIYILHDNYFWSKSNC